MKQTAIFIFLFGFYISSSAQLYKDSILLYTGKIAKYIDKQNSLKDYYTINEKGVFIFASPLDKKKNKPEFFVGWNERETFKNLVKTNSVEEAIEIMADKASGFFSPEIEKYYLKSKPDSAVAYSFKGLKIAIDPGHISGDYETAKLESKMINFRKDSMLGINEPIQFFEGELTLATAKILKEKLELSGAEVMLTRNKSNTSAFGCTFDDWFENDFTNKINHFYDQKKITAGERIRLIDPISKREIFRKYFVDAELKERARKINEFQPDLTVIIHFNVDEKNTDWKKPTNKNFNMAFIPGSFVGKDMLSQLNRFEFLRLIIRNDIERSAVLSGNMVQSFEKTLNVPIANSADADYLQRNCMFSGIKGVYSRNLVLTRLVHTPLVYGETLYQDNFNECKQLGKKEIFVDSMQTSLRIQKVAEAYFEGLKNYPGIK